ncbi:MAG: hypothetical protein PHZ04_05315 [Patescibacteria group bacterium]|nr:hypothetical protein [Patescibacteria group bacterium]
MELLFDMLRWAGSEEEIFSYFIYFSSLFPFVFLFNALFAAIGAIGDYAASSWEET